MTDFAIYPDKVPVGNNQDKDKVLLFNITDFSSIYSDEFIELVWNAIEKQPVFKIIKNDGNYVRGGCSLINSSINSIATFQFENDNTTEYFFTTSDGSLPTDNTFEFGNSLAKWNRSQLWLSSLFDEDFPYYDIDINTNSSNAYAVVKKVDL